MEGTELLNRLAELAHFEYDAQRVYAEALPCVSDEEVAAPLREFLADHVRHFDVLASWITRLGGKEPERRFDAVGRYVDWPTTPHARGDCEGAFAALEAAEHYHAFRYLEASGWRLADTELTEVLRSFSADEDRHKAYVSDMLAMAGTQAR